jgi:hypothetical protein
MTYELGKACINHHIDNYQNSHWTRSQEFWDVCAVICKKCGEDLKNCVIKVEEIGKNEFTKEFVRFKD